MNRPALIAASTISAAAIGIGIASSSSAQSGGERTLTLTEKPGGLSPVDLPPREHSRRSRPSRGDLVVFTKRVFDEAGSTRLGTLHGVCTVTQPGRSIETAVFACDGTVVLRDGQLSFATAARIGSSPDVTLAVTGGSGAYEGARGSIVSREGAGETTVDTVHLLP